MAQETVFGCGNVFADLGLPNPDLRLAKADLASAIAVEVEERILTPDEAFRIAGLAADEMSLVLRGLVGDFDAGHLRRIRDRLQRIL